MMKALLVRGMLAGIAAGLVAFAFAYVFAEPQIEYAIAFEDQMERGTHAEPLAAHNAHEEGSVSRNVQSTAGLLVALMMYGAAMGGLLAIVFALAYGRSVRCAHVLPRAFWRRRDLCRSLRFLF